MTDEMIAARVQVIEGARLIADSCTWLAEQYPSGTADTCLWSALAGLAVTVAHIAAVVNHPTMYQTIMASCDGVLAAERLLRGAAVAWVGDREWESLLARLQEKP